MKKLKRWAIGNKIYLSLFGLMVLFAIQDVFQISAFFKLDTIKGWELYNTYTGPAFWASWFVIVAIIALVYYLFAKDKSESLGILLSGWILLSTGVEDVFYFIIARKPMTACMSWFNTGGHPVSYWSNYVFKENCVSPKSLITFAIGGTFLSYFVFKYLQQKL